MTTAIAKNDEIFKFKTNDDIEFSLPFEQIKLFTTLENLLIDLINTGEKDIPIPLAEIKSTIFKLAIEYITLYKNNNGVKPLTDEEKQDELKYLTINSWEQQFLSKLNQQEMFDLILAANYLENKHLLECTCKFVASDMLKKTDDEIRKMWGVENDFTPEEQALYEEEKKWAAE